jgi:hypothetical protein
MLKWYLLFLLCCLPLAGWGEESVRRISGFQDNFGNQGSFWLIHYQGQRVPLLKLKSADREGDADFVFKEGSLASFESMLQQLRRSRNTMKKEGFDVLASLPSNEATLRCMHVRYQGLRLKMLQIEQVPAGSPKREHQISLDSNFAEVQSALQKLQRALDAP